MNSLQRCQPLEICSRTARFASTLVHQHPSLAEISSLITSKVPSALAIPDIVKGVVEELKRDITKSIDEVKERVNDLEKNLAEKCTILEVKQHVKAAMLQETSKIEQAIDSHLKDEVRRQFRQERDRDSRKLNLVAYGIPLQLGINSDKAFIEKYLTEQHKIPNANISNVRRIISQSPPVKKVGATQQPTRQAGASYQESTHSRPPHILFSVQNLNLKKRILQRSYKLCQEIQFRADASCEDWEEEKS